MNNQDGSLYFQSRLENDQLNKAIAESEQKIKGFSKTAVAVGEEIDDAFRITAENVKIQKEVITGLERDLANLNLEITKLPQGSMAQDALRKQAAEVKAELQAEKAALKELDQAVKSAEGGHVQYLTRIRQLKQEIIGMEQAGKRGTAEYNRIQTELGKLTDAMNDANAQARILAHDQRGMQGIISTLSGLAGGFSAVQGMVGLFSSENENLHKVMLKVQSLMAVTIGLQQIQQTLNKDSAFQLVFLAKAKEVLSVVTTRFATALGITNVQAQILMGTLTLGLSVAITGATILFSKFIDKQRQSRKEAEEFNKAVAENAVKPLAALEQLAAKWSTLGDNIKEKQRFIEDNVEVFDELGVAVTSVFDAENLLVANKEAFIQAQVEKAKAMAATALAATLVEQAVQNQQKLQEARKAPTVTRSSMGSRHGAGVEYTVKNPAIAKLEAEALELNDKIFKLYDDALGYEMEGGKKLKEAGIAGIEGYAEGTVGALEEVISKKRTALKKLTDPTDYKAALREIETLQKEIDRITGVKAKEKKEKPEDKEIQKEKRDTEALLKEYETYLGRKLRLEMEFTNDMLLLQKRLDTTTKDQERELIEGAMKNRREQYEMESRLTGDATYDSMLTQYRSFEQKKQAIIDEFQEKREKAQEFGNNDLVEQLNKAQQEALSSLTLAEFTVSPDWQKLFVDLDKVSAREMIRLKEKLEAEFESLDLTPADLDALRTKIDQITNAIAQKNPFLALSEALKKYNASQDKADLQGVFRGVSGSIDLVAGGLDAVISGMGSMGAEADKTMQRFSGMMQGASDLAMGLATGNPLSIIQGTMGIISNGVDLLNERRDRKLQKSILDHENAVKALQVTYTELERVIDSALGEATYLHQSDQIELLKKQNQQYHILIAEEAATGKANQDKIDAWLDKIQENKWKMQDIVAEMKTDLMGGGTADIAANLGNAIFDAFAKGEDAAEAWGRKVEDVVGDVVQNMLLQKLVEGPVKLIIDRYTKQWVDDKGNFVGADGVLPSLPDLMSELTKLGPGLTDAFNALSPEIKQFFTGEGGLSPLSLSGSIKGITQETASVLAGQVNAIRINQVESNNIVRQQLMHLSEIATNSRYLQSIDRRLAVMEADGVRSQGIF